MQVGYGAVGMALPVDRATCQAMGLVPPCRGRGA